MKEKVKKFLKSQWNSIEYSLWRWWKNLTFGKVVWLLSPIWGSLLMLSFFLVPTMKGECGMEPGTIEYRVVGTTLHIEGEGAMDYFFFNKGSTNEPPWWPWRLLVTRVKISDGVTTIGSHAFEKFVSLRRVEVPDSVWMVDASAFNGCKNLREFHGENVRYIFADAFSGCKRLNSVSLKTGDGTWGFLRENAFRGCENLKSYSGPESISIYDYAFYDCYKLKTVEFGRLNLIDNFAFTNCESLRSFDLRNLRSYPNDDGSGEYIRLGRSVFMNCKSLEYVDLHPLMTEIPRSMFCSCNKLKEIVIPDNVTEIGDIAFYECWSLTNVELPEGLNSIGEQAFFACTKIQEITLPENISSVNRDAFASWKKQQTVRVPSLDLFPGGLYNSDAVLVCYGNS